MSTWTDWQADLLQAANLPNNSPSRNWLTSWHKHANASCNNNPVDVSHKEPGSSNCHKLNASHQAQRYDSHADAAAAFAAQITSGQFPHLLEAMKGEVWWEPGLAPDIYADLIEWGSTRFANWYKDKFGSNWGPGGPGGGVSLPRGHKGFHDLQRQIARDTPTKLTRAKRIQSHALRQLGAPRKLTG